MSRKRRCSTGLIWRRKSDGRRSGDFEPALAAGDLISKQACADIAPIHDLTKLIGISLDLMMADPAGKCLQFEVEAVFRVRRASRHTHRIFAFRTGGSIADAKANSHGTLLLLKEPIPLPEPAFQL
jgi:hypothetical protein